MKTDKKQFHTFLEVGHGRGPIEAKDSDVSCEGEVFLGSELRAVGVSKGEEQSNKHKEKKPVTKLLKQTFRSKKQVLGQRKEFTQPTPVSKRREKCEKRSRRKLFFIGERRGCET